MLKKLFKNRKELRDWLEKNHSKENEIWLIFYKVKSGKQSIKYDAAVEEALCFGWIDSTVRRIDDEKHMQKYTPRKINSNWSATNKERVKKLIKAGLMTGFGLEAVQIAKKNGSWSRLDSVDIRLEIPEALKEALNSHDRARKIFESLAPSRKKQFLWWIVSARRDETKEKRIKETIRLLVENKRPGE